MTFLTLEQLQVEIHVYCFEKRKIIILRQSLNDTRKKRNGNEKEDQLPQQNLIFIPNLHAERFAEPRSHE